MANPATLAGSTMHFTPTQQKILNVLADGRPHHGDELISCLYDELGRRSTVRVHIFAINKKLRTIGQEIVSQRGGNGRSYYKHVRWLRSPGRD